MGYFKPNTKKAIRLAMAIKGLSATIGASAYFSGHQHAGIIVLIIGAVCNEMINFLSDSTDEKPII